MTTEDPTLTSTATDGIGTGDDQTAEKTYTSKDMELVVRKRLEREQTKTSKMIAQAKEEARAEAIEALLDKYGIADESAIEALVAGQGEGQKAQRAQAKHEKELAKMRTQMEEQSTKMVQMGDALRKALINDAIVTACAGKCNDPEVAVALLSQRFTMDEQHRPVAVDADGSPTDLTPSALVEELVKSKPHLALPTGGSGAGSRASAASSAGGTGGQPTRDERLRALGRVLGHKET